MDTIHFSTDERIELVSVLFGRIEIVEKMISNLTEGVDNKLLAYYTEELRVLRSVLYKLGYL